MVELKLSGLPESVQNIPSPPQQLFIVGDEFLQLLNKPRVAIVGSRNVSNYGHQVTTRLARELAEQGIVIVSGLALGVDALAHQAALDVDGLTIAVLAGGLDKVYPTSHTQLAQRIVASGGALVSEYPEGTFAFKQNFIARNRLVSGLSNALLITEAAEKSGSLHTARFALEQGREVLAVPGNITSPTSAGTNNLVKSGATPVTSYQDVLHMLGLKTKAERPKAAPKGSNKYEQIIIDLLTAGTTDGGELLYQSSLDPSLFNQTLTMLEITGKVRSLGANHWSLR